MSVNTTAQARKWERTLNHIKYITFWTFSILIVGGFSYFYYSYLMRPVAGALFFLGGAIIVYYYYIKWFLLKPAIDPDFRPGDQACPDYLTLIPPGDLYRAERDGGYFCVDFVGVSKNGKLMRTTPKTLARDIKNPSYRFKVTPQVDLNPVDRNVKRARAAFMQRLKNAGLSWNSLSSSSIPSRVINSNGAPVYTGGGGIDFTVDVKGLGNSLLAGAGCFTSNDDSPSTPPSWATAAGAGRGGPAPGALMSASASAAAPTAGSTFTLTPAAMKELEDYSKTNSRSQSGPPTAAELQSAANHLIAKGMAPRGTTGAQLMTAIMGGPALNLSPVQLMAIKSALEEYGKKNPPAPSQSGTLDIMTPLTAALNNSLIPKGLVPPGTSAMQLMQELMKEAQRDQQKAGVPQEFMIQSGPPQGRM